MEGTILLPDRTEAATVAETEAGAGAALGRIRTIPGPGARSLPGRKRLCVSTVTRSPTLMAVAA